MPSSSSSATITSNTSLPKSSKLILSILVISLLVPWSEAGVNEAKWRKRGRRQQKGEEGEKGRLLEKVLEATELELQFFATDLSDINLDGLFGLRMGQGQIIEALRECQSSGSCPLWLQHRLQALRDGIESAAIVAIEYVRQRDPAYLQRFLGTVNQPYIVRYTPVTLTHLDATPAGRDGSYNEENGDRCFSRLLGTYLEDGKALQKCNVTSDCWASMTEPDRSRYAITHQLLYFIVIEKENCWKAVEAAMGSNVRETEARICGSIYNEAVAEVKDGTVSANNQDLFLEQVVLCGCLGFENFLRPDWIRMVLTWQKATGCFSSDDLDLMEKEVILSDLKEQARQVMQDLQWEARMIKSQHTGRKLLRETVMKDNCLSHKSGLGFGNLSLYVRFLVRQIYLHQ